MVEGISLSMQDMRLPQEDDDFSSEKESLNPQELGRQFIQEKLENLKDFSDRKWAVAFKDQASVAFTKGAMMSSGIMAWYMQTPFAGDPPDTPADLMALGAMLVGTFVGLPAAAKARELFLNKKAA